MTHKIEFDPTDNLVIAYAQGKMSIQSILELIRETISLAKKMNCPKLLAVLKDADLKAITTMDFYALPEKVTKLIEAHGLNEYDFKRAIVGTEKQDLLPFYETVTLNAGYRTKLFFDIEEAKEWLREQ